MPVLTRRNRGALGWPTGFDALAELQRDFDRLVGRVFGDGGENIYLPYNVDIREDEDHFYVSAEMPGMKKDDIEVTLEAGVLTISGEKKMESQHEKCDWHIQERRYGKFSRSFTLPSAVDESKVNATLKDGVLTITLDKREDVKPKKIAVSEK